MLENKRKFKRFDLPLIVKFRPAARSMSYALGLTKNLSCRGIALESRNFTFHLNEAMEFELKLPQSATSVNLYGKVVWKRHEGSSSYAGINFDVNNEKAHNEILKKISSYTTIPLVDMLHGDRTAEAEESVTEQAVSGTAEIETGEQPPAALIAIAPESAPKTAGFIKQYNNDGSACSVTFSLPKEAAADADTVAIVGDFNDWDPDSTPMIRLQDGDFQVTLTIPAGREYKFRYLIDGFRWENDWYADRYVPNSFGGDDSVVDV